METCPAENIEALFGLFFLLFTCFFVVLVLCLNILYVIAFCKIFKKAGYHWAMGLLILVPIANIIILLYLGFAKWPIESQIQLTPPGKTNER